MYYSSQYVSDELFHFVGRHEATEESQFNLLVKVLKYGLLQSSKCPDPSSDVETAAAITGNTMSPGASRPVPPMAAMSPARQPMIR